MPDAHPEADVIIGPIANDGRTVYVNAYELDLAGLKVLRFGRDADWFDYIFQNRRTLSHAEFGGFGAELQREAEEYQRAIAAVLEEEE